jgi:hypothetical protein
MCAALSTIASANRRPTIWSPTGNPSRVQPHGTEIAGWPVMAKGNVNGTHANGEDTGRPAISVGKSTPIAKAKYVVRPLPPAGSDQGDGHIRVFGLVRANGHPKLT